MEKVYLTMKRTGITNVVVGVLLAICGAATIAGSILTLISGAKLLKRKSEVMF